MPAHRSVLVSAIGVLLLGQGTIARAQITVAAASDLQTVMPEIAARYRTATGERVRISYGSSGQFVAQIQNDAPIDLFLSADDGYVRRLVASGHADRASAVQYARGRLAMWTRSDSGIDLGRGLSSLSDARVRRIAIANPAHAPYGSAAMEALRRAGLAEHLGRRLVMGENVSQAAQFAQTGSADAAIIALSLTRAPAMQRVGVAIELPEASYPPILQTGVIVSRSTKKAAAQRFLRFLKEPEVAALLRASGFGVEP